MIFITIVTKNPKRYCLGFLYAVLKKAYFFFAAFFFGAAFFTAAFFFGAAFFTVAMLLEFNG